MDNKSVNDEVKRIGLDDVDSSMVLAKDIFSKDGNVLMYAGTVLDEKTCNKLILLEVGEVVIKHKEEYEASIQDYEKYKSTIVQREDFKGFSENYYANNKDIQKSLIGIGNGENVDLTKLYALTDNTMKNIKCKSDVFTYIGFLESTDESTFTHSNNVALLCNTFSKWVGMSDEEIMYVTTAGMLHDIGKTKLNQAILNKQTKLTDEEFSHIKSHPLLGYRIMEKQDIPLEIKHAALMHHEKIDGTGYPLGIKDEKISKYAKIVAICDIYDAMTANRSYRKKILPFDVIKTFETNCYGQLDTEFLLVFLQNIAYNYVGSWIKLSNNAEAEIVFINRHNLSKPMVRVGKEILDLSKEKEIYIKSII